MDCTPGTSDPIRAERPDPVRSGDRCPANATWFSGSRLRRSIGAVRALLLVTVAFCLVYSVHLALPASAGDKAAPESKAKPAERAFNGTLPQSVIDMREQILAAVHSGNIADLKDAIEWNEMKPDFGPEANADPIAYWKKISADGEGREVLAVLANLLALPPARLAIGQDPENSLVYVWPYLSEVTPGSFTAGEDVDLYRIMPPEAAKAAKTAKRWSWWRIAIGADGTWHTFRKYQP